MKADIDYIRKGVELADGWTLIESTYIESPSGYRSTVTSQDEILDSLIVQLVRQVDALDDFWVDSDPYGTAKVWSGSAFGDGDLARIEKSNDLDRAMNTLKVIVDSKVLEKEDE